MFNLKPPRHISTLPRLCKKGPLAKKARSCFLYSLRLTVLASVFVFQTYDVETKFLFANLTSEFSHSQDPEQT